jgi:hypothetical protein
MTQAADQSFHRTANGAKPALGDCAVVASRGMKRSRLSRTSQMGLAVKKIEYSFRPAIRADASKVAALVNAAYGHYVEMLRAVNRTLQRPCGSLQYQEPSTPPLGSASSQGKTQDNRCITFSKKMPAYEED